MRPFVRSFVRPSVHLKPKFGQLFSLSCLNLRWSAERTCSKKTKFSPLFYVFKTINASVRPSVHLLSVWNQKLVNFSICPAWISGGPRSGRATKQLRSAPRSTSSIRLMRPSVHPFVRLSVRLSVCPSVCLSQTIIWSFFQSVLLEFKEVRGADVQQKN